MKVNLNFQRGVWGFIIVINVYLFLGVGEGEGVGG